MVTLLSNVTIVNTISKALIINGQGFCSHSTAAVTFAVQQIRL